MVSREDDSRTRQSFFFGSLPRPVFDAIRTGSRIVTLGDGETLFDEGEQADAVYSVLEGQIKLTTARRDGSEIVVDTFHAGTSFAEAMVFEGSQYPVTATALEYTRVFAAPAVLVRREIRKNPDAFDAMLAASYRHLHSLVRQIEQLKADSGIERLARYLLRLSENAEPGSVLELPVEKQVLASLLGVKPETLSRAFRKLQEHGLEINGPRFQITDGAALARFVDGE